MRFTHTHLLTLGFALLLASCGGTGVRPSVKQDDQKETDKKEKEPEAETPPALTDFTFEGGVVTIGKSVTRIPKRSFRDLNGVTKIVGESIVEMADSAFYWFPGLREIDFPLLTKVPANAFRHCDDLRTVSVPKAEIIGDYAFGQCPKLVSVSLPSAKQIGLNSFYDCAFLSSIALPATPPEVSAGAFNFSGHPIDLVVPKGSEAAYKDWKKNGFASLNGEPFEIEAPSLDELPAGVEVKDGVLIKWPKELISPNAKITLPKEIKEIADFAFYRAVNLYTLTAPGVVKIGKRAFASNDVENEVNMNLHHFIAPELKEIGDEAFASAGSLMDIDAPKVEIVGNGAFLYSGAIENINFPKATKIGQRAFGFCANLKRAVLPAVVEIDNAAFYSCDRLQELYLPATPPQMGADVFKYAFEKTRRFGLQPTLYVPEGAAKNYESRMGDFPGLTLKENK